MVSKIIDDSLFKNYIGIEISYLEKKLSSSKEKYIVVVDHSVLDEIVYYINEYLGNIYKEEKVICDEYKKAGAVCFYIRKLKPIISFRRVATDNNSKIGYIKRDDKLINEELAFKAGVVFIIAEKKKKKVPDSDINKIYKKLKALEEESLFLKDLFSNMRYGSFSPTSLYFIFKALFDFSLI